MRFVNLWRLCGIIACFADLCLSPFVCRFAIHRSRPESPSRRHQKMRTCFRSTNNIFRLDRSRICSRTIFIDASVYSFVFVCSCATTAALIQFTGLFIYYSFIVCLILSFFCVFFRFERILLASLQIRLKNVNIPLNTFLIDLYILQARKHCETYCQT